MSKGTRVTDGQLSAAHHLNALIDDLREHTHGPGEGVVDHGDLSDGAIASGITHAQLNTHVQGAGTDSDPDAIGGNQGVHGLPAGAYVLGCNTQGLVIDSGISITDSFVNRQGAWGAQYKAITFNVTFGAAPAVYATPVYWQAAGVAVGSLTTTGCTCYFSWDSNTYGKSQQNVTFSWVAVEVRA